MTRRLVNIMDMPDPEAALLPCPFCGGEAHSVGYGPYHVICKACGARTTTAYTMPEKGAVELWNRRHPPASREEGLREAADNAMNAYVDALVKREHGGIAAAIFLAEIAVALGRHPTAEMDAKRSALQSKMSKLSADRKWWLRQWERGGWSIGNPMKASVKKWREHTRALLKAGLLEGEPDLGPNWSSPMCRITDAGLSALREQS